MSLRTRTHERSEPPAHRTSPAHEWTDAATALDARGFAVLPQVIAAPACDALVALYAEDRPFRSRVVMASHGFGRGEYRYFAYPLPPLVAAMRAAFYPPLAAIANRWSEAAGDAARFPPKLAEFLANCHTAGQSQPTPLLLRYGAGDYNCLHQDVYGDIVFPLQVAILLSEPGRDFDGGEFVITEQRPRMQSRASVVPLRQGDAVIFATRHRPVEGARGTYRVNLRHGVSEITRGRRHTVGIIFHDAR